MKISTESTITETNAVGSSTNFKIKTSATAFKILSEGLYSNKIGSMIRELICNAYDAHCAAGTKDTPIDVELPIATNPVFRIRDYGTGLPEADMRTIYTTYFESTKSGDNQFIGGFGLGSKTPLCYNTEQFFVCSYFNGVKYLYNVSIGNNGAPVLTKWSEEQTSEPNGLELTISVDTNDVPRFKTEFYKFLMWTDIKINRIGYDGDFKRAKYERILPNGNAYHPSFGEFIEDETLPSDIRGIPADEFGGYYAKDRFMVQVGEVAYFVDYKRVFEAYEKIVPDYVDEILKEAERLSGVTNYIKTELIKTVFGSKYTFENLAEQLPPVCLKFGIGEIEVTASREAISFTESTLKTIAVKLLGFMSGCGLKALELVGTMYKTHDKSYILNNLLIMSYVVRPIYGSIGKLPKCILSDCNDICTPTNLHLFDEVVDGFEVFLWERTSLARIQYDSVRPVLKQVYVIYQLLFSNERASLLKELYNIKISNYSQLTTFKTMDRGGLSSCGCDNAGKSAMQRILNGEINIIVSRLSLEEGLKLPNLSSYGIDTTGNTIYEWIRVPTKISGERLVSYLEEANKLPTKFFTFNTISVLGEAEKDAIKNRSTVRKVSRMLFDCSKDSNGDWKVEEDNFDTSRRDAVVDYLKKGETVFVLPFNGPIQILRKNGDYFETRLDLLLNLCLSTEKEATVAVIPCDSVEKFKTTYGKLNSGKIIVLTDKQNEYGKRVVKFERRLYPFYRQTSASEGTEEILFKQDRVFAAYNEGGLHNDYNAFFTGLCLEETPHLKKRVNLISKYLKELKTGDDKTLSRTMHMLRQTELNESVGWKFDLTEETLKCINRMPVERLKKVANKIARLKPDVYYNARSILTFAAQAVIKRLLDNSAESR